MESNYKQKEECWCAREQEISINNSILNKGEARIILIRPIPVEGSAPVSLKVSGE